MSGQLPAFAFSGSRDQGASGTIDLETLYRTHVDDVARWAARLGGPGTDVEDVVHEVFLVARRRLTKFSAEGGGTVKTWLFRTTHFVVRSRRRSERWRRWLGGSADDVAGNVAAHEPTPLEALERRETSVLVYRVLDQMPDNYRTVLTLFDLQGLSGEEVATLTGKKLATLRVWLFRARRLFVEKLRALDPEVKHV